MSEIEAKVKRPRGNPNWVKGGASPNPGGKPTSFTDFRRALSAEEPRARARLFKIIEGDNDELALKAMTLMYSYLHGRPADVETLVALDSLAARRLPQATITVEPPKQLEAPPVSAHQAVPPEPASSAQPVPASGLSTCIYRTASGPCGAPSLPDGQWCQVHKEKLFATLGG